MTRETVHFAKRPASLEAYLLGQVGYEAALSLQQRLVYEAGGRDDGQIVLLLCEHPPIITIGRQGSRLHLRASDRELTSQQLTLRWINRGGGALVHAPGQLAIYAIAPLDWHGWTVGAFLDRFQSGLKAALDRMHFAGVTRPGHYGIWGRSGQLAAFGAAVKNWVTYHGAFLNVEPSTRLLRLVESDLVERAPMSSLFVERQQPVKMSQVRSLLVGELAAAFGCQKHHVYSHHPLFLAAPPRARQSRRVG